MFTQAEGQIGDRPGRFCDLWGWSRGASAYVAAKLVQLCLVQTHAAFSPVIGQYREEDGHGVTSVDVGAGTARKSPDAPREQEAGVRVTRVVTRTAGNQCSASSSSLIDCRRSSR